MCVLENVNNGDDLSIVRLHPPSKKVTKLLNNILNTNDRKLDEILLKAEKETKRGTSHCLHLV